MKLSGPSRSAHIFAVKVIDPGWACSSIILGNMTNQTLFTSKGVAMRDTEGRHLTSDVGSVGGFFRGFENLFVEYTAINTPQQGNLHDTQRAITASIWDRGPGSGTYRPDQFGFIIAYTKEGQQAASALEAIGFTKMGPVHVTKTGSTCTLWTIHMKDFLKRYDKWRKEERKQYIDLIYGDRYPEEREIHA